MVQAFYHRFKQSVPPRRHFADSSAYALDARRAGARAGSSRVPAIVLSDSVPLYRFLRYLAALGFLRREFQPFRESFDRCQPFAGWRLAEHYTVIGAVDDPRAESSGNALPAQNEAAHIAEQWGDTLRGAFPARPVRAAFAAFAVVLFHYRFQPDPSEHSSVAYATRNGLHRFGARDTVAGRIRTRKKKVPFHGALRYPG